MTDGQELFEPWPAEAVRSSLSRAGAFGDGPFEIHVHPSEVHEILAHQQVLDEYGAVVVGHEDQAPGEMSTSRRSA